MQRTTRFALWSLLVIAALPVAVFGCYDLVAFQPRVTEIKRLLAQATPEERTPPATVARVVQVAHDQRLGVHVARLLLHELDATPLSGGMARWHLTHLAWWALVELHLSQSEQTTLYLSRSSMGHGTRGFSAASIALFSGPLHSLSLEQAATLAVVSRSPSAYAGNPERLARHRQLVLQRLQNGL
jgi:hypothetical protein